MMSNINKIECDENVNLRGEGGNNLFRQRDRSSPTGRVNSSSNSPERRYPRETAASRRSATNSQLPGPSEESLRRRQTTRTQKTGLAREEEQRKPRVELARTLSDV